MNLLHFFLALFLTSLRSALALRGAFALQVLFSGAVRPLLFSVIPAGFFGYAPVRMVRDAGWADVSLLTLATVFYALSAVWLFERGLRRYASGSRFGVFG